RSSDLNHQHQCMRKRISIENEKFEDVVKRTGIRQTGPDYWLEFLEFVFGENLRFDDVLLGFPPVDIPLNGVDFSIVCDGSERLSQSPFGNRIGRKPRMDQGHC